MHDSLRKHYLNTLGIPLWRTRSSNQQNSDAPVLINESSQLTEPAPTYNTITTNYHSEWTNLQQEVAACTACGLCKTRTQTVFGVGDTKAKLLIIGEAPGAQEDRQGFPFVGRAGQLLDAMLMSIGLNRQQVYIANILKCRPPNNRDPDRLEVEKCTPFLKRQLAYIQPQLILALGRISAHFLLNTTTPMNRLRGQQYTYGDDKIPLLVTFHPAYLLRSPLEKNKAYDDLLTIKKFLNTIK